MIRRRFFVVSAAFLLLCALTAVLWIRSNSRDFWFQTAPAATTWALKIRGGEGTVYRLDRATPYPNRAAMLAQFPLHYVVSLTGFAAFVSGLYAFAPRRRKPGRCRTCGYDLTGNVSGVCPECGTATPEGRPAQAA